MAPSRRRFLAAALAAAVSAPFGAAAQPERVRKIGLLVAAGASGPNNMDVFFQGMRDLGYALERNLLVETRYAEHREERLPALAEELLKLDIELLIAAGPAATRAAKAATSTVPIVMGTVDPVQQGLIQSLARPGGNITGWCFLSADSAQKQLSLLKQAIPGAIRVGVLANPHMIGHINRAGELAQGARALGMTLAFVELAEEAGLEPAFAALRRERVDAFIAVAEPNIDKMSKRLAALAAQHKLPGMYSFRGYVQDGGLMAYGPSLRARIAIWPGYVDKILKGAKPGDLPVQLPTKFELVLNQRAARELGFTFPGGVLLQADAVIN
jgi:putative ABC transport system substrate-binding protein